ncbi:hypothetical protein [Myroides sp. N17-2]|uniref:hypothetical protein n=1 Tax=Myroides sp. N17-2 TaxID=2030799 RepID=UPI000EFBC638|nr:hypothetical protein [Myroides sp. N17-2]
MKKTFLLMLVAVLGLTATSCSKSDDTPLVNEKGIIGTWRQVSITYLDRNQKKITDLLPPVNTYNWQATEIIFGNYDGLETKFVYNNKNERVINEWKFDYRVKGDQLVLIDKKQGLGDMETYTIDKITRGQMDVRYHVSEQEAINKGYPKGTYYIAYSYFRY